MKEHRRKFIDKITCTNPEPKTRHGNCKNKPSLYQNEPSKKLMKHLEIARKKDKEMYMFSLTRLYKDRRKYLVKGSVQYHKPKSKYWRAREGNFNKFWWGNSSDYWETRTVFLSDLNINFFSIKILIIFNIERMNLSYTFDQPLISF